MNNTNKNIIIVSILAILGLLGFLYLRNNQPTNNTEDKFITTDETPSEDEEEEDEQGEDEITILLSELNDSGESGTATLKEEDGKVKVTIDLEGAPEDINQPAHIHIGNCPQVGEVKYPLTSVVNGKSETTLDTTFDQLKNELPLGVNVHKSEQEVDIYVTCGDITFEEDASTLLMAEESAISVSDQSAGNSVTISKVTLKDLGYVVIHRADENDQPGIIIGNSDLLSGEIENVSIILSEDISAEDKLFAMLHTDDGNGVFESETDTPIQGEDGNPIMMEFTVSDNASSPPATNY